MLARLVPVVAESADHKSLLRRPLILSASDIVDRCNILSIHLSLYVSQVPTFFLLAPRKPKIVCVMYDRITNWLDGIPST